MHTMVTVTANDSSPEMLASIRRGPFATPTEEELIEYLIKRKPRDKARPEFETHSLEHVLSFQRRVHHMKAKFMVRNSSTPLGILQDWWDRTEAQNRAALHSHILAWFHRRRSTAPPSAGSGAYDPRERAEATTTDTEGGCFSGQGLSRGQYVSPCRSRTRRHRNGEASRPRSI